jgi:DNA-binding NarL/FixJ family response regulator
MSGQLRVAVCSARVVVQAGLVCLIERHPDRFVVVAPPDGPDHEDPDVVLYDVEGLVEGEERELRYLVERTHSQLLAVAWEDRMRQLNVALAAGVDGFFSLDCTEAELVTAVASVGDSQPTVGGTGTAERAEALAAEAGLSPREIEVISLVAQGLSNLEVGEALFLSVNSVKTYIRTAYRKMGVRTRAQAVAWALQRGYPADRSVDGD